MVYEGSFKQGLKNGRGVLKYPHGAVYEGEWQEDMVRTCKVLRGNWTLANV